VQKTILLAAIQKEIQRHDLSYSVDEPLSVAQGGKGVVVSGCPACKKRINTMTQFLDHLRKDAMPALIERLATNKQQKDYLIGPFSFVLRQTCLYGPVCGSSGTQFGLNLVGSQDRLFDRFVPRIRSSAELIAMNSRMPD
jgi:hypothetical protein